MRVAHNSTQPKHNSVMKKCQIKKGVCEKRKKRSMLQGRQGVTRDGSAREASALEKGMEVKREGGRSRDVVFNTACVYK